jgi:chromosome segregation ATPase
MIRERSIRTLSEKLDRILQNQEKIMTQQATISQQLTAVQTSLNTIATGVTALDADIQQLQAQIAANSGDNLTPATAALLNSIVSQSAALAQSASTIPGATPLAPPPAPTTP